MCKKLLIPVIVLAMIFGACACAQASTNQPLKNLGKGLDDIVYGDVEVPNNINETNSKGSPAYPECTAKTNDDVGRGIARFVGGVWQIATFWYPTDKD
ncbi:MAG: hypothetical protein PHH49_03715 [Candidatus Omnitrophica bacterium]|nr:hypothetical protein [Candidatus Omnitrophota bacterium]MDD5488056.1 hypothetical protein [Candidatus Omnitrophota bacterium]